MEKIAIGSDPSGHDLKKAILEVLDQDGYEYKDFGSDDVIYANVAIAVAEAVANGEYQRGIIICGTGIGVSIAANKVKGAYAALVSNEYSAERAALSNNANIITMGAQVTGYKLGQRMARTWLQAEYQPGGPSEPKIQRICEYEGK